jgi:hypothetical protein
MGDRKGRGKGRESAKEREGREGGTHVPVRMRVRVGQEWGVGERKLDWARSTRSSERFEFPWEKKGGREGGRV